MNKQGIKTTEFLLVASTLLAGVLNEKLGLDIDPMTLASLAGTVGSYVLSRGWAKRPVAYAGPAPSEHEVKAKADVDAGRLPAFLSGAPRPDSNAQ